MITTIKSSVKVKAAFFGFLPFWHPDADINNPPL